MICKTHENSEDDAQGDDASTALLTDTRSQFLDDVLAGLKAARKTLPCKYFYDERGSELFEEICGTDEYYVTRTELSIMQGLARCMVAPWGSSARLVEYGSGSSLKTRLLLDARDDLRVYHPVDISGDFLGTTAAALREAYPLLDVDPIVADFTQPIDLPQETATDIGRTVVYFPGSTIGNFTPSEAVNLLQSIADLVGEGGGLLIGVDLIKSRDVLEAAYDDKAGVTSEFNLNLLRRINRELGGTFDDDRFEHRAIFNTDESRVEMHLVSRCDQTVHVGAEPIDFRAGETIHTENSHKYSPESFAKIAGAAGFEQRHVWTDADDLFSVQWLVVGE